MDRLKWHIILALALVIAFCSMASAGQLYVNESGWWRAACAFNASGTPIQAAVDAAAAGDMIEVQSGTYVENVDVNKRLTLQGEGADVVTVRAENTSEHVFEVTADWVNISGFTMTGATIYSNLTFRRSPSIFA
jgi:pectin methylesterase-like acyl-CoA thioesterase